MKVKDLIKVLEDESAIHLWKDGEHIATQDSRDSIPAEYHNATVKSIQTGMFFLNVEI